MRPTQTTNQPLRRFWRNLRDDNRQPPSTTENQRDRFRDANHSPTDNRNSGAILGDIPADSCRPQTSNRNRSATEHEPATANLNVHHHRTH